MSTIDDQELIEALREQFAGKKVASLVRRPSASSSSHLLDEVDIVLADGELLPLVFKRLGRRATRTGAAARPAFLVNPRREIEVYRTILAGRDLGTPRFYSALVEPERRRYWLFLERVAGQALYFVDRAGWELAARGLARLHTALAAPELQAATNTLLRYDLGFYRRWLRRLRVFAGAAERDRRSRMLWLASRYERALERLLSLPLGVIHGECYAANVLLGGEQPAPRVCLVDWETAALGPGLIDLAALVAGGWSDAERTSLALAYVAGLPEQHPAHADPGPLLEDLAYCRLFLALQWLAWAPAWEPPPDQRHDWLAEGLRLAEELGL